MNLPAVVADRWRRVRAALVGPVTKATTARLHWPGFDAFFQMSGVPGRERHPLETSAVYQCVNLIANDVAKLPIKVFEVGRGGRRTEVLEHEALAVFQSPNRIQTRNDFMKDVMTHTLLRGNAYVFGTFDGRRRVTEMWPVHPDRSAPVVAPDGSVFYDLSLSELEAGAAGGRHVRAPARNVFHHHMFTPGHKLVGVPPMFAAASASDISQLIQRHTDRFYQNMARPSGVLQTEATLNNDVIDRLREQFAERYTGDNVGKPLLLEGGTSYKPVTMSASDAQQLETMKWTKEEIASAFGVPVFMLGLLSGVTYQNAEQLTTFYYQQCLQPHIEALESRWDQFLGLYPRYRVQYDLNVLLRAELAARLDALGKGVQMGVYTPNEARAVEGLNPIEGGEQAYMQQQMRPLNLLGTEDVAPAPVVTPDVEDEPALVEDDEDDETSMRMPPQRQVNAAVRAAIERRMH